MKILDLVYNILLEQEEQDAEYIALINTLKGNWGDDVTDEEIKKLIKWFKINKDSFSPSKEVKKVFRILPDGTERPSTKSERDEITQARRLEFTSANGEHKTFRNVKVQEENKKITEFLNSNPDFNVENLKDITKYSLDEIRQLNEIYDISDQEKNLIETLSKKWNLENDKSTVKKIIKWFNLERDNFVPEKETERYANSRDRSITYRAEDAFTRDENGERTLKPGIVILKNKIKQGEIIHFLRINPNFDPNSLKDINRYSLKEIKDLLDSYNKDFIETKKPVIEKSEYETLMDLFAKKNYETDSNKVKESYEKLWKGKHSLLYENDGFRVYSIADAQQSAVFGFYLASISLKFQYLHNQRDERIKNPKNDPLYTGGFSRWCITNPSLGYYCTYRRRSGDPRTFYFIIDESKNPFHGNELESKEEFLSNKSNYNITLDSLNYLVALNVLPNGFAFSNISNANPEPRITKEKLLEIFPKLNDTIGDKKVLDLLTFRTYSEKENNVHGVSKDPITLMDDTQDINSQYHFLNLSPQTRLQYINAGKFITKESSWDVMSSEMRKAYITNTTSENATERFSTFELLNAAKASNLSELKDTLITLSGDPNGLSNLNKNLIITKYVSFHKNIKNNKINIWQTNNGTSSETRYGILDEKTFDWYIDKNNVQYEPVYYKSSHMVKHLSSEKEKIEHTSLWLTMFNRQKDVESNDSFAEISTYDSNYSGYLFSYPKWKEFEEGHLEPLISKKTNRPIPGYQTKKEINIDTDVNPNSEFDDINESRKIRRRR